MGRVEGWERRLLDTIEIWRGRAFSWGAQDCLHMCMACEVAITGQSRFEGLPSYRTETGAARHLRKLGFDSVEALVTDRLPEIPVGMAARGDWIMRDQPGLTPGAFGVVTGLKAAFMSDRGLVFLPASSAQRAWRVS